MQTYLVVTHPLPVMAWTPAEKSTTGKTIRIYIEGDGKAWVRKGRPSLDPTPENRLVHYLMSKDQQTDIAYLARPCQYIQTPQCQTRIWTFDRYSKPVVELMSYSVDLIKKQGNYKEVELIGYSGGATIALLLAAQRNDITSVRTIAGNLDPAFTNNLHGVSEMPNAVRPLNYSNTLSHTPQIHFYSNNDKIIPPSVIRHYQTGLKKTNCSTLKEVPATHHSGWAEHWEELLKIPPACSDTD